MPVAICPSCGEDLKLHGNIKLEQIIVCPYCEAELEVVDLDPIELDWADYYEDLDWEEEE